MPSRNDRARVYSRQHKTDRWNLSNIRVDVTGHDVLPALEREVGIEERKVKVRWWLVEDAYGYLHEIRLDPSGKFELIGS